MATPAGSTSQRGDGLAKDASTGPREHEGTQVLLAALSGMVKRQSPDVLSEALRVTLQNADTPGWWRLSVSDAITVMVHAKDSRTPITEAEVHFQVGTFSLKAAADVLGEYKVIAESKTSTVTFPGLEARQLAAYAGLFSSKATNTAAVTNISLRRR